MLHCTEECPLVNLNDLHKRALVIKLCLTRLSVNEKQAYPSGLRQSRCKPLSVAFIRKTLKEAEGSLQMGTEFAGEVKNTNSFHLFIT